MVTNIGCSSFWPTLRCTTPLLGTLAMGTGAAAAMDPERRLLTSPRGVACLEPPKGVVAPSDMRERL